MWEWETTGAMQSEPQEQSGEAIFTGTHGEYFWLTSSFDHYSGTLVKYCPEIFIGRFMVVTAIDSGIPRLRGGQEAAGWEVRSGIAYSPRLSSVDDVFYQRDGHDVPGFDEWYFFQKLPNLGELQEGNPFEEATAPRPGRPQVFVGMPSATVHDTNPECEIIRQMFWDQIGWIQPESYVADSSDCLTFVTRDRELFELVLGRLSANHKL
jgi:hypothetical protein